MDVLNVLAIDHAIAQMSVAEVALIGPGRRIKSTVAGVTRWFEYVSGDKLSEASYSEQIIDFSKVSNAPISSTAIILAGADGSTVTLTCVGGHLVEQGATP
ncbi:MAG: hypothetical protein ABSA97_07295 [Verrucomicrobiia bacterium]